MCKINQKYENVLILIDVEAEVENGSAAGSVIVTSGIEANDQGQSRAIVVAPLHDHVTADDQGHVIVNHEKHRRGRMV